MNASERQRADLAKGKPLASTAVRTMEEVAAIMTRRGYPMGRGLVYQLERKAIAKLREALADLATDTD